MRIKDAWEVWARHLVQCRSGGQACYPRTNDQHGVLGVLGPGTGCNHAWVPALSIALQMSALSVELMLVSHLFVEVR